MFHNPGAHCYRGPGAISKDVPNGKLIFLNFCCDPRLKRSKSMFFSLTIAEDVLFFPKTAVEIRRFMMIEVIPTRGFFAIQRRN